MLIMLIDISKTTKIVFPVTRHSAQKLTTIDCLVNCTTFSYRLSLLVLAAYLEDMLVAG